MFSKTTELAGLTLLSLAFALLLGPPAGLLAGGLSLLLIGSTTDDAQVTLALRRGAAFIRRAFHRHMERENEQVSPHPPIHIDPETERVAQLMAAARIKRGDGRMREATP